MADFLISWQALRQAYPPRDDGPAAESPPSEVHEGQWIGGDGETEVGESFTIEVAPPAVVEAFWPGGAIEHVEAEAGLEFAAQPPEGARELRICVGGRRLAQLALDEAMAPAAMPPVRPIRFGPAGASFVYPVFAERFEAEQPFNDAVQSLYDWIIGVPPFDRPDVRAGFGIDAYYWRSPGPEGHFRTRDIVYDCANPPANAVTFLGDNGLARRQIGDLLLDGRHGLVLINSRVRGGAGGMPEHRCPAWASITSCPRESWQAVALHEIAHGLGLADEYRDRGRAGEAPGSEPNVARTSDFGGVRWKAQLTERPATASSFYSLARQQRVERRQEPVPADDFIGVFQGARYRDDLFRASWTCLMRSTATERFCEVCAASIVKKITGAN